MRLRTQVAGLVLLGAVATALNVVGGTLVVVGWSRSGDAAAMQVALDDRWPSCAADPATWAVVERGFVAHAYDPSTGRSANPEAPPRGEQDRAKPLDWVEQRGVGPCGEVVVRSALSLPRTPFPLGLLLAIAVPAGLAVGGGAWVGRRFVRRVEALADHTQQLGQAEGWVPPQGPEADELAVLAEALQGAHARIRADAEALQARQQATEQHLWAVAHDLRTPLAHLQVQLEGLPPSEEVAVARRELADLVALTDNLHQQARLDGGLAPVEEGRRFDLAETVRRLEVRFGVLAGLQDVSLSGAVPDGALWVVGDEDLAERALGNLLHNAVRHGAGQVGFVLDAVGEGFRFVVRDDGPGLPEAVAEALSSGAELPRAAARTRGQGGLGLGIVRQVVARHGWRLEVLDEGEGAGLVVCGGEGV